jgi:cytochrome P450
MNRFDPLAPAVLADPYPHYATLRATDPIHWGHAEDAGQPGRWYITRYADVMAVLKDPRFGREVAGVLPPGTLPPVAAADHPLRQMADGWMILRDPPTHTRLRGLVSGYYTPRRVAAQRPVIAALAHDLIDRMLDQGSPLDLLTHFTLPLTVRMTARLLGLPPDDYDRLMPWSRALAAVIDLNQSAASRLESRQALADFTDYLAAIIAARRRQPQDDLITALLGLLPQATTGTATKAEVVGTITHLLFVGNDPVMHQLGLAVYHLLRWPEQRALVQANSALIGNAVDELLRYDSSVQATFRYALTDVELHGKTIRTGDHIAVLLAAANRDAAVCPHPDTLDITRPVGQVATFGAGIHYCLGAPLARLEGQIGLQALLQRLPTLALITDQLTWQPTVAVRGPLELPVTF